MLFLVYFLIIMLGGDQDAHSPRPLRIVRQDLGYISLVSRSEAMIHRDSWTMGDLKRGEQDTF